MIHILTGTEKYLIDVEADRLAHAAVKFDDFNEEVYTSINTLPLFEESQKLLVTLQKLPTGDRFLNLLESGVPSFTTLVIVVEKLDKRSKAYSLAKRKGIVQKLDKVSEEKLKRLLCKLIQSNDSKIKECDMDYLIKRSGYLIDDEVDLYQMNTWCKQLCYAAEVIGRKDINAFVPESDQTSVFALTEFILAGKKQEAVKLAQKLIEEKESPIRLLSLLLRTFRLSYKRQEYRELTDSEAAEKIGVTVYQLHHLCDLTPDKIGKCMDIVETAISRIKRGMNGNIIFYTAL